MKHKMKWLALGALAAALAGCSQDSSYEDHMQEAEEAMEDFRIDDAVKHYEAILELNAEDLTYGDTRMNITKDLLSSTVSLKESMDSLKKEQKALSSDFSSLDYSYENIEALSGFSYRLSEQMAALEEYPATSLYKDAAAIEKTFEENISKKLNQALLKKLDQEVEAARFLEAETVLSQLFEIQETLSVSNADLETYQERIDTEKSKYIAYPFTVSDRNVVLYENDKAGKITFLGESMIDGEYKLFYKYEGGLRNAAEKIDFSSKAIFSDGDYYETDSYSAIKYDDYTIVEQSIGEEEKTIKRIDYYLDMTEKTQTINLEDTEKKTEIEGLLALGQKDYETNLILSDKEKTINIKSLSIGDSLLTVKGTMKSDHDTEIDGDLNLSRPYFESLDSTDIYEELFSGIEKEFEAQIELHSPIRKNEAFVQLNFMGMHMNIDVNTGKEYTGGQVTLPQITYSTEDIETSQTFNQEEEGLFTDTEGTAHVNVLSIHSGWSGDEGGTITIPLSNKYQTFSVTPAIDQNTAGKGYGSSKLSFIGDGKVLKDVKLSGTSKPAEIELDTAGLETLVIKLQQESGEEGQQQVLLTNGIFKMK